MDRRIWLAGHESKDMDRRTWIAGHGSQNTDRRTRIAGHELQDTDCRTRIAGHVSLDTNRTQIWDRDRRTGSQKRTRTKIRTKNEHGYEIGYAHR